MRVNGRHTFSANREVVWSVLYDAGLLASILPGCEAFETVSLNEHRITLSLRVGQAVDRYSGTLRLDRIAPLTGFNFHASGESPSGRIMANGRVYLEDTSAGDTLLCYEADFEVSGPIAVGTGRTLQTAARAFARRSLERLERQIDLRTRVFTTTAAPAAPSASTAVTRAAEGMARRVALLAIALLVILFVRRMLGKRGTPPVGQARELLTPIAPLPAASGNPERP